MNDPVKLAVRVSVVTLVVNFILSLLKFAAGLIAGSSALVSDAVHSASDVLSTLVVIVGVRLASKNSDSLHPYGHERFECVAALLLSFMLALTGFGIGFSGVKTAVFGKELPVPSALALVAAVASIVIKEWMYRYTIKAAKALKSDALTADAWHHRSDSLSSIGSFVGVLGARLGAPALDPVASVVISLFVLKAAFEIFKDCVDKMIDRSCDEDTVAQMRKAILACDGVIAINGLRTRLFGPRVYVDVEICCNGELTLFDAHDIARCVHDNIERQFPQVKHCMVHVDPIGEPLRSS